MINVIDFSKGGLLIWTKSNANRRTVSLEIYKKKKNMEQK